MHRAPVQTRVVVLHPRVVHDEAHLICGCATGEEMSVIRKLDQI